MGSPIPLFLIPLKAKYYSIKDLPATVAGKPLPLGKLSVFLSLCADGTIECTEEEKHALREVNDNCLKTTMRFIPNLKPKLCQLFFP